MDQVNIQTRFDIRFPIHIRLLCCHNSQPLVAYVTFNHSLSIWNYEIKHSICSFNVQTFFDEKLKIK